MFAVLSALSKMYLDNHTNSCSHQLQWKVGAQTTKFQAQLIFSYEIEFVDKNIMRCITQFLNTDYA